MARLSTPPLRLIKLKLFVSVSVDRGWKADAFTPCVIMIRKIGFDSKFVNESKIHYTAPLAPMIGSAITEETAVVSSLIAY